MVMLLGSNAQLLWPITGSTFALQSTPNLAPSVAWQPVTNSISQTGGQLSTAVDARTGSAFYRLSKNKYSITTIAGAHGSLSPSGLIVLNPGASQAFSATLASTYVVDVWRLDGNAVQTGGPTFFLPNIQADHTVSVSFRQ